MTIVTRSPRTNSIMQLTCAALASFSGLFWCIGSVTRLDACPPIPCDPAQPCLYDPVVNDRLCFVEIMPNGPCSCHGDENCTEWYLMIVGANQSFALPIEDREPPSCVLDGPCYQCFEWQFLPCYYTYKCVNNELGLDCDREEDCEIRLTSTFYILALVPTGKVCCYWAY